MTDTSKDDGIRGDGVPCGYHPGYSYTCDMCKLCPDPDPDDIEDYRNYYPDPDRQPWTEEELLQMKIKRKIRKRFPVQVDDEGWPIPDKWGVV